MSNLQFYKLKKNTCKYCLTNEAITYKIATEKLVDEFRVMPVAVLVDTMKINSKLNENRPENICHSCLTSTYGFYRIWNTNSYGGDESDSEGEKEINRKRGKYVTAPHPESQPESPQPESQPHPAQSNHNHPNHNHNHQPAPHINQAQIASKT